MKSSPSTIKAFLPSLTASLVQTALQITFILAYAVLVFGQSTPNYMNQGVGILLLGSIISVGVIGLLSSYVGSMGSAQDIPATLISVVIGAMAVTIAVESGSEQTTFYTAIGAMMVATFGTALLVLLLSIFNLGNIVRFIPFPVIGGLLASTGWVLALVALGLLVGEEVRLSNLPSLFEYDALVRWTPGLAVALCLMFIGRFWDSPIALPSVLLACSVLVHLWLVFSGTSIDQAQATGLLLSPGEGDLRLGVDPLEVMQIARWDLVLEQWPLLLSLCFLSAIISMVQVSSIEVAIDHEMDIDRELLAIGSSNIIISAIGGLVAYHHISNTKLAHRMGARSRLTAALITVFCSLPFLVGSNWIGYFPISILGGIILFLGLEFLIEWVVKASKRLPMWEYFTILVIFCTVVFYGFAAGLGVGVLCGILLFLIRSSRINVVHSIVSGKACKSVVIRSSEQEAFLAAKGGSVALINLRGFLFFGSAGNVYDQIKTTLNEAKNGIEYLVVDFKQVTIIDYTAVMSLYRVRRLLDKSGIKLLLSNVPKKDEQRLVDALYTTNHPAQFFINADFAIEAAEENLLAQREWETTSSRSEIDALLLAANWSESEIAALRVALVPIRLQDGEHAMCVGEVGTSFYFIEHGKLEINQERGSQLFRLRVLKPGSVIGEMGVYSGLPRSADVNAVGDTLIYELDASQFERLEQTNSRVAIKLHRILGKRLTQMLLDDAELHALRI